MRNRPHITEVQYQIARALSCHTNETHHKLCKKEIDFDEYWRQTIPSNVYHIIQAAVVKAYAKAARDAS